MEDEPRMDPEWSEPAWQPWQTYQGGDYADYCDDQQDYLGASWEPDLTPEGSSADDQHEDRGFAQQDNKNQDDEDARYPANDKVTEHGIDID